MSSSLVIFPEVYSFTLNNSETWQEKVQAAVPDWFRKKKYEEEVLWGQPKTLTPGRFPIVGEGILLVKARLGISEAQKMPQEIVEKCTQAGIELGRFEHQLGIAVEYPNLQRQYCVAQLGTVWDNSEITFLTKFGEDRILLTYWFDKVFEPDWRFLVIDKVNKVG